jgi:hypothetical protein
LSIIHLAWRATNLWSIERSFLKAVVIAGITPCHFIVIVLSLRVLFSVQSLGGSKKKNFRHELTRICTKRRERYADHSNDFSSWKLVLIRG